MLKCVEDYDDDAQLLELSEARVKAIDLAVDATYRGEGRGLGHDAGAVVAHRRKRRS